MSDLFKNLLKVFVILNKPSSSRITSCSEHRKGLRCCSWNLSVFLLSSLCSGSLSIGRLLLFGCHSCLTLSQFSQSTSSSLFFTDSTTLLNSSSFSSIAFALCSNFSLVNCWVPSSWPFPSSTGAEG